jgi:hypothetical protein
MVPPNRVDLFKRHELGDFNRLGEFRPHGSKIFLSEQDELAFLVFVALHHAIPGNFLAGIGVDAFISNARVVPAVHHVELDVGPRVGARERDRDVDQPECN